MLRRLSRATVGALILITCTLVVFQLDGQGIIDIPTPQLSFGHHNKHRIKPLALQDLNSSGANTESPVNAATLSQTLFPVSTKKNGSWTGENREMLTALFRCMELSDCGPNQQKVVLLASQYFLGAYRGNKAGEEIWASSTVEALRILGYSFIYTRNIERTIQLYQMMPGLVRAVLFDYEDVTRCFKDYENCILSVQNPDGIPVWKILSFHFWTRIAHPLGRNWTLSPEPYGIEGHAPNTYLGYSVETSCRLHPFIEHKDREDRGYIMAKHLNFVVEMEGDTHPVAWPPHFYEAASNATGLRFVLGTNDAHKPGLPPAIENHGLLPQPLFLDTISRSRILIGVGTPLASPTPYDALCLGVPFINPIRSCSKEKPKEKSRWNAQHGLLKFLDPPFVYNVCQGDLDGFVEAIKNATLHPIDSYLLDRMRMTSVTARLHAILERDWKSEAAELMERRKAAGEALYVI